MISHSSLRSALLLLLFLHLPGVLPQGRRSRNRRATCATIDGIIAFQGIPEPVTRRMPDSCFTGLNLSKCNATDISQDSRAHAGLDAKKPYCAEVCSNANTIAGINGRWLKERDSYTCEVLSNEGLVTGNTNPSMNEDFVMTPWGYDHSNLYMYEFRFKGKTEEGDDTVVSCPLPRSACSYTPTGVLMGACGVADDTYLKGYRLRVTLAHVYRDTTTFPDDVSA
jgi:hypothetical protein